MRMLATKPHAGENFSRHDFQGTAAGYVWRPLSDGKVFEDADVRRQAAIDRRYDRSYRLHIGYETFEVPSKPRDGYVEREFDVHTRALSPAELSDEELSELSQRLTTQVREANELAQAEADEAVASFNEDKAASIEILEGLLSTVRDAEARRSLNDPLGLSLRKALATFEHALSDQKSSYLSRSSVVAEHRPTDTLLLAHDEVCAELRARSSAKAAKQAEVRAMLAEAGFAI